MVGRKSNRCGFYLEPQPVDYPYSLEQAIREIALIFPQSFLHLWQLPLDELLDHWREARTHLKARHDSVKAAERQAQKK